GIADVHSHQITDYPELRVGVDRIKASDVGLTQQDVAASLLVSLSSTTQVSPNFWVNPENRVNYRVAVQTPQYHVDSVNALMNTPIINAAMRGTTNAPPQLLSNLADLRRDTTAAVINHYDIQTVRSEEHT